MKEKLDKEKTDEHEKIDRHKVDTLHVFKDAVPYSLATLVT